MAQIIKTSISTLISIILIAVLLWFIVSYIEVISHNVDASSYNYSNWNCFIILINNFSPIH